MNRQSTSLRLRVVPGAKQAAVVGRHGGAWKVRVTAAAEAGKANEAVLELLSRTLAVPRRRIELRGGHGSRDKIVSLDGVSEERAVALLAAAAEGGP